MDKPQTLRERYEEEKQLGLLKFYPHRTFEESKAYIEARIAALKKSCEEKYAELDKQWSQLFEKQKESTEKYSLLQERLNLLIVLRKKTGRELDFEFTFLADMFHPLIRFPSLLPRRRGNH